MKFELPILDMKDLTYTIEEPYWGSPVNWSYNASNIQCRAESLDSKVYVLNNLYRVIADSFLDLIAFLSKTDSFLQTSELQRVKDIEREVSSLEDEIDDLLWEKDRLLAKSKSPFVLLKSQNIGQLNLKL